MRRLPWTIILAGMSAAIAHGATVAIHPAVRYQTILGWGKTTPWLPAHPLLRQQVIDQCVNDFGLNRLRFEGVCGNKLDFRSWEWLNDNADPHAINWSGFNTAHLDRRAAEWLVPWQQAVQRRGEPFDLYVSPSFFKGGSTGDLPPWMNDPNEYAEWAVALLLRLRDQHGVVPTYYSICNEAGNSNVFTPQVVAAMIGALMPRLRQLGFEATVQFPECVNATVSWNYVQALQNDPDIWRWIGLISYHWYGGNNQAAMQKLADFARARNLPTAQTEFMDLTMNHLYDDLTIGNTSYWEVYGLCSPDYEAALSHISSTTFRGGPWYWRFRQVSHYVRPGATRIQATADDPAVRVLAFDDRGRITTVLIGGTNTAPVTVTGLPPGLYGRSQAIGQRVFEELGPVNVGQEGTLAVSVPGGTVLTVYPRTPANQPPTMTEWRSEPQFLTQPANSVRLIARATDADRDALSCAWSVTNCPPGAQPRLTRLDVMTARADGLTVPGDYVFTACVSDAEHEVSRAVLLKVFTGNQPPVPNDVHNRIPVWVRVRDGGTLLRAAAWDIEGDPVTFRWSVAAQPPGAPVLLETPDKAACKVTGMTVAGDYIFRLDLSDPTHTVTVQHTVPVYP